MLVRLPQTLYVTEHFQLGRFGQVVMSSEGRLKQPTNVVEPGAPALALQAANNLNRIIIDDALNEPEPGPHPVWARWGSTLRQQHPARRRHCHGYRGCHDLHLGWQLGEHNAYRVRPINAWAAVYPTSSQLILALQCQKRWAAR
jgi:uncharacterized protein